MPTLTTNLSLKKPLVNNIIDQDQYGDQNNENFDTLDSEAVLATVNKNYADKTQSRMRLKDYGEIKTSPTSSSGTLTLNIENGNHFTVTLTENVTTLTISNPTASGTLCAVTLWVKQDGTGGRTFAFPAAIKWAGTTPTITSTASATDIFVLQTIDGGATWAGSVVGQNFTGL